MKKRIESVLVLLVISCMMVCACSASAGVASGDEKGKAGNRKRITIGVSVGDVTISSQSAMYNWFFKAQDKYDNIEFVLPNDASDSVLQVDQIEMFIARKVDAIIISAVNDVIAPFLKKAVDAGIPVFAVNRPIADENAYSYFIGPDDARIGQKMAGCLIKMTEKEEIKSYNIIYVQGDIGATYQTLRQKGFDDIMKEKGCDLGINILERIPCKHNKEMITNSIQNILNKYPAGKIDAIVCEGADDAIDALRAVKDAGREELIGKIIGADMSLEVWEAIKSEEFFGTVFWDPTEQCEIALETLDIYFYGNKEFLKDQYIETDVPIVTAENVNDIVPSW